MRCDAVRVLLADNAGSGVDGYMLPGEGRKANTTSRSCENGKARVTRKGGRGAGNETVRNKAEEPEPNAVEDREFYM